jgi:hypothetical protein
MVRKQFSNKLLGYFHNPNPVTISNRIERLVKPPRRVPIGTACAALTGFVGLFGAIFFSFGMIFVWVFGAGMNPIDEWRLSHSTARIPAVVEEVSVTNASENEVKVYEYRFRYTPGDGLPLDGHCYTTGRKWNEGEHTPAIYLPGNPEVACLEGARLSHFTPWILLIILIFPAVGLGIFIPTTVSGWRKVKLLRYGEITGAQNISVTPTNTMINDTPVMKYSYEFRDGLGRVFTGDSRSLPTGMIGDEKREPVLYLPSNPERSMLVDALPLRFPLEVNEDGQWRHRGGIKPVMMFLAAWIPILIHVLIALAIIF